MMRKVLGKMLSLALVAVVMLSLNVSPAYAKNDKNNDKKLNKVTFTIYKNGETEEAFDSIEVSVKGLNEVSNEVTDVNNYYSNKEGFVFEGWYTKDGFKAYKAGNKNGEKFTKNTKVTGNIKLFAMVTDYCDVVYTDGVGGKAFESQTYKALYGTECPEFDGEPVRAGYEFKGWDIELPDTVTESVTANAVWEVIVPDLPGSDNVQEKAITVVCDTVENHKPVQINWLPYDDIVTLVDDSFKFDESLETFVCQYKLYDAKRWVFTMAIKNVGGLDLHDIHTTASEGLVATLYWDMEKQLWIPLEEIVFHTTCKGSSSGSGNGSGSGTSKPIVNPDKPIVIPDKPGIGDDLGGDFGGDLGGEIITPIKPGKPGIVKPSI